MKKYLFLLLFLAFFLRVFHLNTDLLFHRDQGLHSLAIYQIWHEHHLSLLGHPSDVDGLYHAPIYYWLMTPAYLLTDGDPAAASIFQITLEILTLPFFFIAIKRLFNRRTALYTLILYIFSYGLISYSRWLVNVTPILPFTHLLLYLLSFPKPYSNLQLFLSSLIIGLITQLNAAIGIFLFPLILYLSLPLKILRQPLVIIGFLLPATPLLLFDLRHQFVITHAILNFLHSPDAGLTNPLSILINNTSILFQQINQLAFYPLTFISGLLFILGLIQAFKLPRRHLIYTYLFIPFFFLAFFKRGAIGFFLIALLPLCLALIGHAISSFPQSISLSLLTAAIFLNLLYLPLIYRPTNALIPIGDSNLITLQDRKNTIDWVYSKANHQPFSLWYYTLPYYQEEVWDYLFLTYALPKYGYLPEKTSSFSRSELTDSNFFFTIYEPDSDHPDTLLNWLNRANTDFGLPSSGYTSHDLHTQMYTL